MKSKSITIKSIELFKKLQEKNKNICFLHSTNKRKSILTYNPKEILQSNNLIKFKKFIQKHQNCLLIGYFSYDFGCKLHNIKLKSKNDLNLPEIYFLAFENWIETDKNKTKIYFKNNNFPKEIEKIISIKEKPNKKTTNKQKSEFKPEISFKKYTSAFNKIKKYLKEGDIYQINLTQRLKRKTNNSAKELFLKIIKNNPVDFLTYIEGKKFEILSASPERFIKIKNKKIISCPIKGTRPRGKNPNQDKKLKQDLINNKKEAAELNMITDLIRNDMGKISKINSVKVKGHRLIQKCPTVWHTYSDIISELNPKYSPIEGLISMIPGGSITGCPKKRAIQIIDELEPFRRGIYTGNIGYIKPEQKELDFSIAIRTIIKKNKDLYLQVGGGIVIDSNLKAEYQETLDKAKSFMQNL